MEYLVGALATAVILLLYDRIKKPKKAVEVMTVEEKKREKELADHFEGLFNYTPEQAYRKVKHG